MQTQFDKHFTFKRLLKFVYPSVIMMVFTSIYGVVDGIFVANFAGDTAFAAVNLIIPVVMAFASLGFMLGTGGSALVSKILGEGDSKRAVSVFSLIIYVTIALGAICTLIGELTMRPIAIALKAEEEGILEECVLYGSVCMGGLVLFMLQNVFQSFMPVAEKPKLGLIFVVAAGLTNAALDAVFIAGCGWGLIGAAAATVIGQAVGGVAPLLYFIIKKNGILHLGRPALEPKSVLKACGNGSSEMMTNLSLSVVNILYNYQLMSLVGKAGVEAYGVLMYLGFIFISVFLGYSLGVAPIIGFNYGAKNAEELKSVLKKSLVVIAVSAAAMFALSFSLSYPLSYVFANKDAALLDMTVHAFRLYSFIFLIAGFNIFASAFFTALNNGLVSAIISFLRTLILQIVCVFALPALFPLMGLEALDGVWLAGVVAEALSIAVSVTFLLTLRKKYGY